MAARTVHTSAWELARRQHWVVTGDQLRALGLTRAAIRHRLERGRLYRCWPNTYVVGRASLSFEGSCLAAVFTCGKGAILSHDSAAAIWGIRPACEGPIEISIPCTRRTGGRRGIKLHRRRCELDTTQHKGIPITTTAQTILDIAAEIAQPQLERAINEADKLDLLHPARLREAAEGKPGAGAKRVRGLLDRHTFVLTDSELERLFVPLVAQAGLPRPQVQAYVNGFRVDFYFADIGLVVETDGGRFHRTPTQQTRDRLRDQAHLAAGLTPLRFTHGQIRFDPEHVVSVLRSLSS